MNPNSLHNNDDHVLPFRNVRVKDCERGKIVTVEHQLLVFIKPLCVMK